MIAFNINGLGRKVGKVSKPAKVQTVCTSVLTICFWLGLSTAHAADLLADLSTLKGEPASDVVLLLVPHGDIDGPAVSGAADDGQAEMVQKDLRFAPYVLPVRKGSSVSFPNKDDVRHHVYSFSKPKKFELKLYGGNEDRSVVFSETGIVALGCNIHDSMLAYVVVSDAPHFGVSDTDGHLSIKGIEPGSYTAQFWHPQLRGKNSPVETTVLITEESFVQLQMELDIKVRKVTARSGKRDKVAY